MPGANSYAVAGTVGGAGTLLDPWGTLAEISGGDFAAMDADGTLWCSGNFTDRLIVGFKVM